VEIVQGDVRNLQTLPPALKGATVVYYLIQNLTDNSPASDDSRSVGASNFSQVAKKMGVGRIIYLGTLGSRNQEAGHFNARMRVGNVLRESGVPVTEFKASVIVGSGSLTFEMIRYLTERVPILVCPRWVTTRVQPIAVETVLDYLEAALDKPESINQVLEIGGPELLTYREMLRQYADVRGLRRLILLVPVVSPRLSSYWVHWITPVPASIARHWIDSLRDEAIVQDNRARYLFPEVKRFNYKTAVRLALGRLSAHQVETTWNDALVTSQGDSKPVILTSYEGMLIEQRRREAQAPTGDVYNAFTKIGGGRGWPYMNWAWRFRGSMDRLIGGVGMRRGRRDPEELRVGDALDFWRVEEVDPGRLLRLRAEMKLPGNAWLQFETTPAEGSMSNLTQTAYFASKGLAGLLYWYLLYPIHGLIFSGMIRELVDEAEKGKDQNETGL
jgi:uncharacterized protein YbjT (DUF2867 family)